MFYDFSYTFLQLKKIPSKFSLLFLHSLHLIFLYFSLFLLAYVLSGEEGRGPHGLSSSCWSMSANSKLTV